ncbi:MAG: hypothetical protein AAGG11_23845, partial [Pseudomonadota bacterium]
QNTPPTLDLTANIHTLQKSAASCAHRRHPSRLLRISLISSFYPGKQSEKNGMPLAAPLRGECAQPFNAQAL